VAPFLEPKKNLRSQNSLCGSFFGAKKNLRSQKKIKEPQNSRMNFKKMECGLNLNKFYLLK